MGLFSKQIQKKRSGYAEEEEQAWAEQERRRLKYRQDTRSIRREVKKLRKEEKYPVGTKTERLASIIEGKSPTKAQQPGHIVKKEIKRTVKRVGRPSRVVVRIGGRGAPSPPPYRKEFFGGEKTYFPSEQTGESRLYFKSDTNGEKDFFERVDKEYLGKNKKEQKLI